jgi:hypothetical protein
MNGSVRSHVKEEIRYISGRERRVVVLAMSHSIGIKMWTRRLEIGPFALCNLVDMDRVFSWRQILNVQLDSYALRHLRKHRCSYALTLGISDVNNHGVRSSMAGVLLRHSRSSRQHNQAEYS